MSNEYFENFKSITYMGYEIKDIIRRTRIVDDWENNPMLFLPYTVEGHESAEEIAHLYYGDPHLVWLIYLANNIINPYTDWVMDNVTFGNYLEMKYKEESGQSYQPEIIAWTMTQTKFYINDQQMRITPYTYECLDTDHKMEWTKVSYYDYEEWKNESKRNIRLVNKSLAQRAAQELRDKLNDR